MNREDIIKKVESAGVVGAGGGGFPTDVKISAKVENLIANGTECELLLSTDRYLLENKTKEIMEGLRLVKKTTGARNVFIAVKEKYKKAVSELNMILGMSSDIELHLTGNYYPAGDEHELVYNITATAVPEGGIPLNVGTVVINVNTLLNVYNAVNDIPVTTRWITVAGELEEPYISEVPVGIGVEELIKFGKPRIADYKILVGGPMMGKIVDKEFKITKLCAGVVVLPPDHIVAFKQGTDIKVHRRRGSSICDQCFDCTIVCPRNLLGHDLEPHKIMRNLFIDPRDSKVHLTNSYLCCECGLCNMFACPMDLAPRELLVQSKNDMIKKGVKNPHTRKGFRPHPERDFRRVNTEKLMARIDVAKYDQHEFPYKKIETNNVRISLKQHAGVPAKPVVKVNDKIKSGDIIGKVPPKSMGSNIHASINGEVSEVSNYYIEIK